MRRRILFVDDEPQTLDQLRRMLRPLRDEWDMACVTSGHAALATLIDGSFDVVVTDLQMPGMDGAALLEAVRAGHPHMVRIILTGPCSREAALRAVRVAHRQLNKPCDADHLKTTVVQACALRDLLSHPGLRTLMSRLESVPSLPAHYAEVVKELEGAEPSLQKVGRVIAQDAGMSAKILQMVHSAFFGPRSQVSSPAQAVLLLGSETTKILVLTANIFSRFNPAQLEPFSLDRLWKRGHAVSDLARQVAVAENCEPGVREQAAMAGLLADVGQLILAGYLPSKYREVLSLASRTGVALQDAEHQLLGCTHAEVGAYLLGLWGLPDPIVEAVAWHHHPSDCPATAFSPLTAVHVADALLQSEENQAGSPESSAPDLPYLERLGLANRLPAWCELRQTLMLQEASA